MEGARDLWWLLAVLNDQIATWLFRRHDPDEVRKTFPQVRVGTLRRLPLPPLGALDPEGQRTALRLVAACVAAGRRAEIAEEAPALRALVARAFGLSPDEAGRIRARVSRSQA